MFRTCIAIVLCALALAARAQSPAVESFSPEGEARQLRQVKVLFATQMVPFGEPTAVQPFEVNCPAPGKGRWVDGRNWVYEFERDLPAGLRCAFETRAALRDVAGEAVAPSRHEFSTGGPAIVDSLPWDGEEGIDENQVFVLALDAPVNEATVLQNVWCDVQGRAERVPVKLVTGKERKAVLDRQRDFVSRAARSAFESAEADAIVRTKAYDRLPVTLVACRNRLPAEAEVRLVWGAGIASVSGVAASQDQTLTFKVRPAFVAKFSCSRTKARGNCIPVLPMALNFTAPVAVSLAERVVLKSATGEVFKAQVSEDERKGGTAERVQFKGPFPEATSFTLTLPEGVVDDAGRKLANASRFPLTVKTDPAPPLVKFAARFGILEWKADPALPLTVRNVEKSLAGRQAAVTGDAPKGLPARMLRVQSPKDILYWMKRLDAGEARWTEQGYVSQSVFGSGDATTALTVPRPGSEKDFEVIGIPLKDPGFHVVEVVSPRLGQALLKDGKPYHVSAGALVTNLAVHFKWGRESSLVWVTTLDKGEPAGGADVAVLDCSGKALYEGKADRQGIARIAKALPKRDALPPCRDKWDRRLFITARVGADASFAFSDWDDGIETWRFRLPSGDGEGADRFVTVLDRMLFRAGDTVNMKHFARRRTGTGFAFVPAGALPVRAVIRHLGTWQTWEALLTWNANGTAESAWTIPKDAKLGEYEVIYAGPRTKDESEGNVTGRRGGSFRVEAFRLPVLRADVQLPAAPQVAATSVDVGVQLSYLSGGGASGQRVRLRAMTQPKAVSFEAYEGFAFANGDVRENTRRFDESAAPAEESADEDTAEPVTGDGGDSDTRTLRMQALTLDGGGAAKTKLDDVPVADVPRELLVEVEYADPNGQIATRAARTTLWPSRVLLGVRPDGWALSKDKVKLQVAAVDPGGRPLAGTRVSVDLFERASYAHRKRLVGGFYAYEYGDTVRRAADFCEGETDARGVLTCEAPVTLSGNLIFRAKALDADGRPALAHADAWVAGSGDWWFDVGNDDRMDVLPEQPKYEPGDTAVVQVRAPFRQATALVTVEREGVLHAFVTPLSGKAPVVKVPLAGHYAPNAFISVLAVRGRVAGVQPTALVDLGRPAFRLGIASVRVGWKAHTLQVKVAADRDVFRVREKAKVGIDVVRADGKPLPKGAEVAVAAVDEALLDLLPNTSWQLLEAMMQPRSLEVDTVTAVSQVVGRRHFGKKAVAPGGGGGRQVSRELFDTLLLWRARVRLDAAGHADVEVPLNDSLTGFRIVAVASAGAGLFGTGGTTIRSTQDLQLLSGLPPLVREGDRYTATFTVRNAADRAMDVEVDAGFAPAGGKSVVLERRSVSLAAGAAEKVTWTVTVPANTSALQWTASVRERSDASGAAADALKVAQKVSAAVPVRVVQATLARVEGTMSMAVAAPGGALPGRGEVRVELTPKLGRGLGGVRDYMVAYPFTCLEQRASKAVALRDTEQWNALMAVLPMYLDRDGLAKYFPGMTEGSEVLTAYLLSVAHESGWTLPDAPSASLRKALSEFVAGRLGRSGPVPASDLAIRKVAALEALTRYGDEVDPAVLSSFEIRPDLWPTSAVLDWWNVARRWSAMPDRERHAAQAETLLRARLDLQGTRLGFSTEGRDALWWLMVSGDSNANRMLLATLDEPKWREDVARLARGAWQRQKRGHWDTTVANAWGALAMEKFSQRFEAEPVTGATAGALGEVTRKFAWRGKEEGGILSFDWPAQTRDLTITHEGNGTPWAVVQSRAALPRTEPFEAGYRIRKSVTPVEGSAAKLSSGDVVRVRLDLEAQADMTWVVVDDPVPAGATILGSGLGGDSEMLAGRNRGEGMAWLAFEERGFDAYRSYYAYVPKGSWRLEYTLRLNTPGQFQLPPTRVEAMYAPEMFAEHPNPAVVVK